MNIYFNYKIHLLNLVMMQKSMSEKHKGEQSMHLHDNNQQLQQKHTARGKKAK